MSDALSDDVLFNDKPKKKENIFTRFFKSKSNQYLFIKWPVGAVFGSIIGYGYYKMTFGGAFQESEKNIENIVFLSVMVLTTIGCTFSVQCRCIAALCLPTMVGTTGKGVLKAMLTAWILAGPVANVLVNASESIRSIVCVARMQTEQMGLLITMLHSPVSSGLTQIVNDAENINDTQRIMSKNLEKLKADLWKQPDELSANTEKKKRRRTVRDISFEEPANPSKKLRDDAYKRCLNLFSYGIEECKRILRQKHSDCMETIGIPIINSILCLALKATFVCNIVGWFDTWCGDLPEYNHNSVNSKYYQMSRMENSIEDEFEVDLNWKVPSVTEDSVVLTVEEISDQIESQLQSKKLVFEFALAFLQKIVAISFIFVLSRANSYNTSYMTDFRFDNLYITSYFKRKDKERKEQGKRSILPLTKMEKRNVISVFTIKMTTAESKSVAFRVIKLIFEIFFTFVIFFFDYVIFYVLDLIRRHARVNINIVGRHKLEVHVEGNRSVALLLKRLFLPFEDNVHTLNSTRSSFDCLPKANRLLRETYLWIYGLYGVLLFLTLFDAYALRLRHVIASLAYRRVEKKRIIFLYSDMMRRRKNHIVHVMMTVRKLARNHRLQQRYSFSQAARQVFPRCEPLLRFLRVGAPRCIICDVKVKAPEFARCDDPKCHMYYCKICWVEAGSFCWACKNYAPTDDELRALKSAENQDEESSVDSEDYF